MNERVARLTLDTVRDPAKRCAWVFGQPMKACPRCGGYKLGYQTPVRQMEPLREGESVKSIVGKWARAVKAGNNALEGPVFVWCQACFHKGPALDCTGRTAEDVGRDKVVADEVKRLWNSDENR